MKQTPEYDSIQRQMLPGVITLEGFLGTDTRKLIDILSEDDSAVRRSEKTHEQIAQRMQFFRDAGMPGLGEFMSIDDVFDVRVDSVRGKLPSPFGGPGMYDKVNTTVVNKRLGREVTFTDLHIHFIRDHGFYEGKGSLFRLEPHDLIEILEV
ncbi:MAG TPA: hypothetical protein DHV69_03810 [Sphaerochaeta sp.]|jgi:hypothetical protein|nr:MAG: hypothetical protein A2Y31_02330 [Spirochaetes bacterium GWC2_52_13]PKL12345.1 MAG: hypothetical protein CVV52_10420 [Spirochaetae bacterium HGW-Spirochaetae-8]PKL22596.1 MAG: hypothetical protein CVV48_02065 [Spirochaetae bacterium HGW-Spirochaetae-4]HCG62692.1 hypothetical protein [Sphaerochaeta sp.]HCJ94351.1 hypothetical protein [Sphaerochaeta sp.]